MTTVKREILIPHYSGDRAEVDELIDSIDTDCVMCQMREGYLEDRALTISLLGLRIDSQRCVGWEIKCPLRQGGETPDGMMGVALPSRNNKSYLPIRFKKNWSKGAEVSMQYVIPAYCVMINCVSGLKAHNGLGLSGRNLSTTGCL